MVSSWDAIRNNLIRSSNRLEFQRGFDEIRQQYKDLASYSDPTAVLDALHRNSGPADYKNELLGQIVRVAQTDDRLSDIALTLMLLALWPGLDTIRRRSLQRQIGAPDEIVSELLARATDAIRSVDLSKVNCIAATILKNIERDTIRTRMRDNCLQKERSETDPDELTDPSGWSQSSGLVGQSLIVADIMSIIGDDATLVIRVVIDGLTQAEAATEIGVSEPAARKRYQRAIKRLRETFGKID